MRYKLATTTRGRPPAPRQALSARRRRRLRRPGPGPRPGPGSHVVQQGVVLVGEHGAEVGQVALQEHALRERRLAAGRLVRQPVAFDPGPGVAFHQENSVRRYLVAGRHLCGIKFRAPYAIDATRPRSLVWLMAWSSRRSTQPYSLVDLHTGLHDMLVVLLAHGRLEGVPVDLDVVRGERACAERRRLRPPRSSSFLLRVADRAQHNTRACARSSRPGASANTLLRAGFRCVE